MKNYRLLRFLAVAGVALIVLVGCSASSDVVSSGDVEVVRTSFTDEAKSAVSELVTYVDYSPQHYKALLGNQPFALSFHADWCLACFILDQRINDNLEALPSDFTILKVDYDNEIELEKQYNILGPSIVLIFDEQGEISMKLAAPTFEMFLEEVIKVS